MSKAEANARKRKRDGEQYKFAEMLRGKVVLVTGAGMTAPKGKQEHGIGSATALALMRAGATVVAMDIDEERAKRTADLVRRAAPYTGECHPWKCDVASADDVKKQFARCASRFRRIDGLVNVVGMTQPGGILEVTVEQFRRVMDVNVTSAFLCIKHALPFMLEHGCGSIVNVGSLSGVRAIRPEVAYATSKGAVNSLTTSVALEFAGRGIRCNAVLPGLINTPLVTTMLRQKASSSGKRLGKEELADALAARDAASPTGQMGEPGDCAALIAFLMSDASAYINGAEIPVDGGLCMKAAV